jgi:hypothetical protein
MGLESAPRTEPPVATHLDAPHRVFPPLELKPCHPRTSLRLDPLSVPRSGRVPRESEAWEDKTFFLRSRARCVVGKEHRSLHRSDAPPHDGTVRVLYAARIADCRPCPLRMLCQEHGTSTKKPRRVSAVLHPLPQMGPEEQPPSRLSAPAPHPVLWGDWSRSQPRRAWIRWQRSHLVTVEVASVPLPCSPPSPFSRAEPCALASDVATTARTQRATTHCPASQDDCLWALVPICPGSRFACRLR